MGVLHICRRGEVLLHTCARVVMGICQINSSFLSPLKEVLLKKDFTLSIEHEWQFVKWSVRYVLYDQSEYSWQAQRCSLGTGRLAPTNLSKKEEFVELFLLKQVSEATSWICIQPLGSDDNILNRWIYVCLCIRECEINSLCVCTRIWCKSFLLICWNVF